MSLTLIGAIQLLLGIGLVVRGSLGALLAFLVLSGVFGGSSAIDLPALGGSSVTPAHFALVFLLLRCMLPGGTAPGAIGSALRAHVWLVAFVAYGVVAALLLPHIFAGEMTVAPLRGLVRPRYGTEQARVLATEPLRFTVQNLTTAIYMAGTLAAALASHAALRGPGGARLLARTGAAVGVLHALLGIASVVLKDTPANAIFAFLRNGSYAQLDNDWAGFVRMNGLFPEPSAFAAFAVAWFVFNFECWLRAVEPRLTGAAALLLACALAGSASSTAYAGLAICGALGALRLATTPRFVTPDRLAWLALGGLTALAGLCALLLLDPVRAAGLQDLLAHMTLDKGGSFSGRQRLFWAGQGLDAFVVSRGLGIGPGSFRSSSLATAILGSMGVVGSAAFVLHLGRAFAPLALSTYRRSGEPERDTAAAAAWAMLVGIAVASLSAPSCDPGLTFAVLSGGALALRQQARGRARAVLPPAEGLTTELACA
ncbi:hypothetical protein [Novosphingobium soli]|uniref:Glycoside hydrolase n=1 Tax=Novosphingobium soli TaxID=574956 RepID=A0ABV6CY04_9SPHN